MKVVIVYPEVYDIARFYENRKEYPPFGALYLAATLEQAGIDTRILKVSPENTILDLRGFDAVAFSISSSASYGLIKEARFRSFYSGDPLIMVGGVHPSFYPEETLLDLQPHVVGIGEGEETILELLQECHTRHFAHVKGVCYFDADGKPTRTHPRPLIQDINNLPLPARHLLPASDIVMDDRLSNTDIRMAHVMVSRGCPFHCRFCGAAQTKIQYRSGASVREELIHLVRTYSINGFAIVDDNFIVNKKKVREVCLSIGDLNLKWSALSRVDTIDEDLVKLMHKTGCIEIKFGVESGSPKMLKAMQKNITLEQIRSAIKIAYSEGIKVKVFMIHGYPGENAQTTQETLALLQEIQPMIERATLFRFVPLPGTYVYEHPEEFNLRGTNRDADWDGNWSKYHIIRNYHHWWGTDKEFREMDEAYKVIHSYIESMWPRTRWGIDHNVIRHKHHEAVKWPML